MLNVVTNLQIANQFKRSQYFRQNLGLAATVEKNGDRILNPNDKFSFQYNNQYKTTIYAQGNVGNVKFYVDHYIRGNTFAVYSDDFQEFLYEFDINIIREKGVDFYIGHILKDVDERYDEIVRNNDLKKMEVKPIGVADKVFTNPGNVKYEDLKAYLEEKNKNRYL